MLPQSLMQTALQKSRNWNSAMEKQLLTEKHPVLLAYLRWEVQIQQDILTQLSGQPATEQIAARIDDVKQILAQNARALAYYE